MKTMFCSHFHPCREVSLAILFLLAIMASAMGDVDSVLGRGTGPFGLKTVIAFYGEGTQSQTFVRGGDWREWADRGGVVSRGVVHQSFLKESVSTASDFLVGLDFGDNPNPVVDIDEFGWDYDGGIDQHTMGILRATHAKRPGLKIAVWQMRGPVAPLLASVYRDTVDLVMMETYTNLDDAWMLAFQLQAARLNGLMERSVVALGLGSESRELGGNLWTRTSDELEQQIRLIRYVAPESPGLALFGMGKLKEEGCLLTDVQIEKVCSQFEHIPTDGRGLTPELVSLAETFTRHYENPALFCSSYYVFPDFHSGHDGGPWGQPQEPPVARVLMMNLGQQPASMVKIELRDKEKGVWARGAVDLPARSVVVAVLTLLPDAGFWGWGGTSIMAVEAPGCEVFNFTDFRNRGK